MRQTDKSSITNNVIYHLETLVTSWNLIGKKCSSEKQKLTFSGMVTQFEVINHAHCYNIILCG